ncbi:MULTISPECIES: thiamine pyrophosphate-binding protein [unclassified Comamonas]|uniref:thiamine pyrophosphate-binding protein n=1 Tax=unclassified Comamonas TaxID=2638500 RepID=UPI001FA75973|nr:MULTISPECIES: thiamine pyrophosphate-binding protein [unclassified Comamonas]UNV90745.1 thiamine pyrophosphate-binding protein [Comamonas sp. 7D-2evo1]UNV95651.1 thiamine pyrophosphate-binding protein [Comamonas sp. 7D-2]UNW00384.1 thiamine pyrophosphate-binding protein [Comamonas sp. 7D-2evo2]
MATVAQVIGKRLHEAGCHHAFGIPGGEVLSVMKGLDDAGVKFTLVKHENSGGFMAEGVFHRTGAPGVLIATLGPGVANAVNVVANALQDRVPMLFVTGCVDEDEAATYTHQVFDHAALMRPITKASIRISAGAAQAQIDKAIAIAMDDPPGPVHIDVPISVANQEVPETRGAHRVLPAPVAPALSEQFYQAREWLAKAKRPVMIAGVDALYHRAEAEVEYLAEELQIPLITTYKAKGIVDERHEMVLGGAGLSPQADKILLPLIQNADLILLAGYDPIEMRTGWRNIWDENAKVVEFAATRNTHYMHQASITFVGDVKEGLAALSDEVLGNSTWTAEEVGNIKERLANIYKLDEEWGPGAIVDVARKMLPDDTIASVDSGAHRILLSQTWNCYEPRSLMQSSGLCTMGCSLPLGIGAKLADPERPVVVFTGDACLEMTLGELATARDAKTPVIVIVFADESLSLIEIKQRANGQPNLGVDFESTDFAAVSRSVGGLGFDVSSRDELAEAINTSLKASKFSLISCRIPRMAYDGRI